MCGICGIIGTKENREETVKAMLNAIRHRGPDGQKIRLLPDACLGFCRLSIIDLEGGMQPMTNEDGSKTLVFNGEIYNYQKLREELAGKGHVFTTRSDSETILHGFEEYGEKVTDHLRGMFAFAIWDEAKKELFAARDFFGIKPFFYTVKDGQLLFASEIKALLQYPGMERRLNREALEQYLSFQYAVTEETFFQGIYRLPAGHLLTFKDGKVHVKQYFDPLPQVRPDLRGEKARTLLDETLADSVKAHMISDVEVGSFLSGGVDSSYIAATFSGTKTFSVGFLGRDGQYSEISRAETLAKELGLEYYTHDISREEYWEAIPKVMYHLDEPSGDASAIALYFVAQEASRHVKVAESGEGSDEFFGGYPIYLEPKALSKISWLPKGMRRAMAAAASRLPEGTKGRSYLIRASRSVEERFIGNAHVFTTDERRQLLKDPTDAPSTQEFLKSSYEKVQGESDLSKMQYIDTITWLPGDILQKADRMSMAHSLEVRVPFLDKEVFAVAKGLGDGEKVRGNQTKCIFRSVAAKYLPQVVSERKKLGFPVPIRVWMKQEEGYEKIRSAFESREASLLFHTGLLLDLLEEHRSGKKDNSRKIWTVYAFLVWQQVFQVEVAG